jgi:predicted transcriptional regulator
MAATSIKLPDDLKARIAPLAEAAGLSPHAWMLRALAAEAERAERRADFLAEGRRRLQEVRDGGELLPAREVFARLEARLEAGLLAKSKRRAG